MSELTATAQMIPVFRMDGFVNTHEGWQLLAKYGWNSQAFQSAKAAYYEQKQGGRDMNELLNIQDTSEYPVSGRALHARLEIGAQYSDWFKRMCKYGFEAGKDFQTELKNVIRADGTIMPQQQEDHLLTLSMAKELCMLQRTEQGREVRRYLIGIEEQWNQPDAVIARALQMANRKLEVITGQMLHLEAANSALTVQNEIMKPKADYFDELVDRNLLTNFRETCKQFGVKERQFVTFLLERKFVYRDKRGKLLPFAQYAENGMFEVKECVNEKTGWSGTQTLITPKGREAFRLLMQGLKSA